MSMSGVTVSDSVVTAYNQLKTGKVGRFILMTIKDEKEVVVQEVGARGADYEKDFLPKLAADTPLYAVFDYESTAADGPRDKLLFISWVPDTANVKQKMLYASSKSGVITIMQGGVVEIAAADKSDLTIDALKVKLGTKK